MKGATMFKIIAIVAGAGLALFISPWLAIIGLGLVAGHQLDSGAGTKQIGRGR